MKDNGNEILGEIEIAVQWAERLHISRSREFYAKTPYVLINGQRVEKYKFPSWRVDMSGYFHD